MRHITTSEKQTFNLAKDFAKQLKGGEVVWLVGDLGAGKTVFTKGLAAGFGVRQSITSPTFVLMRVYNIIGRSVGRKEIRKFCHIDAYRINTINDLTAIGAEEYFYALDTVAVIEWADKVYPEFFNEKGGIKKGLPKKIKLVIIKNKDNNKRIIKISNFAAIVSGKEEYIGTF